MEAPLLALTRPPGGRSPETVASENMRQLVQLRWLAVGGQLLTVLAVRFGLGVPLLLAPMLGVLLLLALANVAATVLLRRHRVTNAETLLALLLDMGALTAQLYLSGGASNPFTAFYLLQVVLGAILLERWSAWVLVGVACLCFAGLTLGSVPVVYPAGLVPVIGQLTALGAWLGFALTGTLLALFVTRIIRNLRARDAYLADLQRQAAEADGIVRMGLFASGAAHELGTPLATLAVILSDWRRMPKLAGDPELAGELAEMQAEVQRCKAIVTDILHSAGEPRGEALARVPAAQFVAEVVAGWRAGHPAVALEVRAETVDGATVVADPALRQALANLLDNAAEASPAAIGLRAERTGDDLVLAVADAGPGFPPAQLASLGKLYQSSKGAGHGLGLFLAANVARRLGGRLDARNRDEGGAEVRLTLPLVANRGGRE